MDFVRSGEKEVKECKDVRCEGVHNLGMAKGKVNICTGRRDIHIVDSCLSFILCDNDIGNGLNVTNFT